MGSKSIDSKIQRVSFTFPDGSKHDGSLERVDGNSYYELSIEDLPEQAWPVIEKLEALAKRADDKYLFLDVHFSGRSWHEGRSGSRSTTHFLPLTTLYTNDPDNPLSQNVSSMYTSVDNLDLWLNKSLFSFNSTMRMSGNTMHYDMQQNSVDYDFKGFRLNFDLAISGMQHSRFTREVNLKQGASIGLHVTEGADDTSYIKLVEALRSLERLIGLAFRSPMRSVEVSVASKDHSLAIGNGPEASIWPAYEIILSDARPIAPQTSPGQELSFTHDQIEDFQTLLDKWCDIEAQITPAVDLFLSSISGHNTVLENIFLNCIQGIEGFHRSFRPGNIQPQEDYKKEANQIINNFTGTKKSLLKKVLKRGNDISLADRLRSLDTELKLKGIPTIMTCDMNVVAHTRDYYSHYKKDIIDICPPEKMAELTHQAGQMLYALILTELGISDEIVRKAIRDTSVIMSI